MNWDFPDSLQTLQDFCGLMEFWMKGLKINDADQYIKIVYNLGAKATEILKSFS